MSWTQGIQVRADLPAKFLAWADGLGKGDLQAIVWWEPDHSEVILDYGEAGSFKVKVPR